MIFFSKRSCTHLLYPGEYNLMMTTFSIFEMLISDAVDSNPEDYSKFLNYWFQAALIYSIVWGIGGLLNFESRDKFDAYHREVMASF